MLSLLGPVTFLGKPILLMDDCVIGQNTQGLGSCTLQGFVFGSCNGENFGKFHGKSRRDITAFTDDAILFHAEQRKATLQTCGF